MAEEFIQIVTTTAKREEALAIAKSLVESRLAACVQIDGPVESVYRWQEAIETATEWRCTIKARKANFPTVAAAIRKLHSYEVPEIIALPICDGANDYLQWLADETN